MARLHGRGAILYLQGAGTAASQLSNAADFDINIEFAIVDVSQLGDDWVQTIRGQGKWVGTFAGPFDNTTQLPWDSMIAGLPAATARAMYLYPDKNNITGYYYGLVWPKLQIKGGVGAAITFHLPFEGTGVLSRNP